VLVEVDDQPVGHFACCAARPRLQFDLEAVRLRIIMQFHCA
jgi:hypothetical protein